MSSDFCVIYQTSIHATCFEILMSTSLSGMKDAANAAALVRLSAAFYTHAQYDTSGHRRKSTHRPSKRVAEKRRDAQGGCIIYLILSNHVAIFSEEKGVSA